MITLRIGRLRRGEVFAEWERELFSVRLTVGRTWVGWSA